MTALRILGSLFELGVPIAVRIAERVSGQQLTNAQVQGKLFELADNLPTLATPPEGWPET